jgi:hypothetical protein
VTIVARETLGVSTRRIMLPARGEVAADHVGSTGSIGLSWRVLPRDCGRERPIPAPTRMPPVRQPLRHPLGHRLLLRDGGKGITVTARDRVYNLFEPEEENPDWSRSTVYTLDFARTQGFREAAETMAGK